MTLISFKEVGYRKVRRISKKWLRVLILILLICVPISMLFGYGLMRRKKKGFQPKVVDTFAEIDLFSDDVLNEEKKVDTKPKRRLARVVILLLLLCVPIFVILGYKHWLSTETTKYESDLDKSSKTGVLAWLNAFTSKDYTTCDTLISDTSYKIMGFDSNPLSDSSLVANDLYTIMYNKISDAIISINTDSVEKTKTGTTYNISITYSKYEICKSLEVDFTKLSELCDRYVDDNLEDAIYLSELGQIYTDSFKKMFVLADDSCTTVIKLSEREINGVTYVYHTKEFIDSLLADMNITSNVEMYEEDIQKEINKVLIQY